MDISIYLLAGLLLAALLRWRTNAPIVVAICAYWILLLFWSTGLIDPFSFKTHTWLASSGITFSYHIDGLSDLFTLLISGIGSLIFVYAYRYLQKTPQQRASLFAWLQIFAISMLGIVLADDMIMLFLCWELTTIASYRLIQFDTQSNSANQAAFNSLFINVAGSLALLVGFIVLNQATDSWSINHIVLQPQQSLDSHVTLAAFILIFIGAITKSAQFPLHFWLTGAMKAPTPVSAYLHSATMVNAGIYLLARFHPAFDNLAAWYPALSTIGLLTMAISSIIAFFQDDLKILLAYTTIFALGTMIYLLGSRYTLTIEAFAIFLFFHGIYKAGAFMLVGVIDQTYGTRNLPQLRGIAKKNPIFALTVIIIFGAMAGVPPLMGFTIKEMLFEAKLATESVSYVIIAISLLSSVLISATSFRCLWYFFIPEQEKLSLYIKTIELKSLPSPAILAIVILFFSVTSEQSITAISATMESILITQNPVYINPNTLITLGLSLFTVISGIAIFALSLTTDWKPHYPVQLRCRALFESGISGIITFGKYLTRITQYRNLTDQLRIFFISLSIIILLVIIQSSLITKISINYQLSWHNVLACLFLILSAGSLLTQRKVLQNIISLSLVGFASSFFFMTNGAVDVAITQLLIEVLTIIILLIALSQCTITPSQLNYPNRLTNASIAILTGITITSLLLLLQHGNFSNHLATFYQANSLIMAHGRNIVNTILVDFRSLDTLGEALVVVIAAIATARLLQQHIQNRRSQHADHA